MSQNTNSNFLYSGKIALVGTPNVGKSLLFNILTNSYVAVSNYPGTTVEVARGKAKIRGEVIEIIDTPGMYSLMPVTEEEQVARRLLLEEKISIVLHVVDAKNLQRHLPMTLQLLEAGFKVILILNMMDEAEKKGIEIDVSTLAESLKIPVIPTILIHEKGVISLKTAILQSFSEENNNELPFSITYPEEVEKATQELSLLLKGKYPVSYRQLSHLLISGDEEVTALVISKERNRNEIIELVKNCCSVLNYPPSYIFAIKRFNETERILRNVYQIKRKVKESGGLSWLTMAPVTGIPVLLLILYFGLYKFVGGFGAGYLVELLEIKVFNQAIIPWINNWAVNNLPGNVLPNLLALDYGLLTLGLRYAVAIVLPIVGTFFFFFSILEDSGYLPRLALLVDKVFKGIGLSGRSIIPLTLGLGCGTMAVIVTRTLESKRERVIATFLLALAVPCSAQLGLFLGILSFYPAGLVLWAGVIIITLITAGTLVDKFLPGEKPSFYMEVPPLRFPSLSNIFVKTFNRIIWYSLEVIPVFLGISLLVSLGHLTGVLDIITRLLYPLVEMLGLPQDMAFIFLLGFFRRDYGAAGLYDLYAKGLLDPFSLVVAAVTLTLFLPCLAQLAIMVKERGGLITAAIFILVAFMAFGTGALLRVLFLFLG